MAKAGKRVYSDWAVTTHSVNSYKSRVSDPAVKRKRRKSKDICTVIAQALNKVKKEGREVNIRSASYKGRGKVRQLYKIKLFKSDYYALCAENVVITLLTSDMIENDVRRGGLEFTAGTPFEDLTPYYA
ncbi:hypothetical protein [Desulfonema ishimotonii]|uniref:hypothetical protein n=1 Tax=Desulfonema ishimotonii TaxID=45657 RepID=UPI000F588779|nr:hypothetical protein [Desulfonema ishimotonii]